MLRVTTRGPAGPHRGPLATAVVVALVVALVGFAADAVTVGEAADGADGPAPKRTGAAHVGLDGRAVHGATVRDGASLGFGTVFALGTGPAGRLVSAAHVVDGTALVRGGGTGVFVPVPGADLASARLGRVGAVVLERSDQPTQAGALVMVAGHPRGSALEVRRGQVLAVTDGATYGQRAEVVVIDADVEPGFSGGPVVDADGAVVGVMFAVEARTGVGLAHPVAALDAAASG